MKQHPFALAAAGLASVLLHTCLHGEQPGDRAAIHAWLEELRRGASDELEHGLVAAIEEDVAGLPLFSPDQERPVGRRGYMSLVIELEAWAQAGAAKFQPWLAPRPAAPYTASDAARDNYVATKSVTYVAAPFSLRP